jgi:hypothetical protein
MKHGAAPARRVRVGRRSLCTRRAGAVRVPQGPLKQVGDLGNLAQLVNVANLGNVIPCRSLFFPGIPRTSSLQ